MDSFISVLAFAHITSNFIVTGAVLARIRFALVYVDFAVFSSYTLDAYALISLNIK